MTEWTSSDGRIRLICGDALACLRDLPDGSVHLVVTSPPYNIGVDYGVYKDDRNIADYLVWMQEVFVALRHVLVLGGRVCVNIGENNRSTDRTPLFAYLALGMQQADLLYRATIIWQKDACASATAWGSWRSPANPHIVPRHEYVLVFSKGDMALAGDTKPDISAADFTECSKGTWYIKPERRNGEHPAPFPEELVRRLILFYSYPGQSVLDPFGGSGTTAVVALKHRRRAILIDLNPAYYELAKRRIECELAQGVLPFQAKERTT